MRLITRWTRAAEAADRWAEQYRTPGGVWESPSALTPAEANGVHERLLALGPNPHPDLVDEIVGNYTWTDVGDCGQCGEHAEKLVEVGEPHDVDSRTAWLCGACLFAALRLFDG